MIILVALILIIFGIILFSILYIISLQPTSLSLRISDTYNFIISTISAINEED